MVSKDLKSMIFQEIGNQQGWSPHLRQIIQSFLQKLMKSHNLDEFIISSRLCNSEFEMLRGASVSFSDKLRIRHMINNF